LKGLVVALLVFIASGVGYLAYTEMQKQNAVDDMAVRIIQSRVADGLRAAAGPKAAVTEYYYDEGQFPNTWYEAGVSIASMGLPSHIKSLELEANGVIVINYDSYSLNLPASVSVAEFKLIPTPNESGDIEWSCAANPLFAQQKDIVPAACWP